MWHASLHPGRWLELLRLDMIAAAISHLWLMIFLARADAGLEAAARVNPALAALGTPLALGLAAAIGLGLAASGMALNDALDARHDRAFAPERPIPAGRVSQRAALAIALGCLLAAAIAAVPFGPASMAMTLIAAGGIIFYNFTGRFMPALGIITLGLLQGLIMAIPNPGFTFAWPAALAITHVMGCEAGRYRLAGKRPALSGRRSTWLLGGWLLAMAGVLTLMSIRGGLPGPMARPETLAIWLGPLAAVVAFVIVLRWLLARHASRSGSRRALAGSISRLGMLWLSVYDAVWLFAAGLIWQGLSIGGLLLAACVMIRGQRWLADATAASPQYRVRPRPPEFSDPGPG